MKITMDTATQARENAALPRILHEVGDLARPLGFVQADIHRWASSLGFGVVYNSGQFRDLCATLEEKRKKGLIPDSLVADLDLAKGTLSALALRPENGWDAYIDEWTAVRLEHRLKVYKKPEFARLKTLEQRIGGVLLGSQIVPLMLILPQPTGTYIQMGWDTVVELDRSPFSADRNDAKVLRQYLLPEAERTFRSPSK